MSDQATAKKATIFVAPPRPTRFARREHLVEIFRSDPGTHADDEQPRPQAMVPATEKIEE